MSLIKLSAGNDDFWLLNDIPKQRGEFDISAKIGGDVVELHSLTTLKSLARGNFDQFSPDGVTPYGSTQLLVDDLKTFFDFIVQTNSDNMVMSVFNQWKTQIWGSWEEANNCYMNLEVA